jgi:hypothetical protein
MSRMSVLAQAGGSSPAAAGSLDVINGGEAA